ncbi:MAG: 1-phosphofructokinase [Intestinibacter bartlettii]|uniref:1-phosphofructokinase n=1 Tax=Intestinibacter bartlettii TaxID=261299 RepID=UPI0006C34E83|nr:1-phosphofructokinase [Intestinibacter bartlettii]MBS7147152.1 1-phosphofructokinase [Intestinibacter bartlettii]CUO62632.1 1-phosphofructokinase [Intestinibacter bartlettii]
MIYTVTLNPSIDYVIKVDKLTTGNINRVNEEHVYPGGKGINVTRILKSLDNDNIALGFVSGFTGDYIINSLQELNLKSDFIKVKQGFTRINVKVKSEEETEINGQGPKISEEELNQFYKVIDKLVDGDILILSGSIPSCLDERLYESIMKKVEDRDIKVIVDATKNLLLNVLKYKPFLIKPNNHELAEMFNVELNSTEDVVFYAIKLKEMGAQNVLISMGKDGALLVTENDEVFASSVAKGEVVNSVGAGDSMVAGFIAGYLKSNSYEEALRLGAASGGATAFSSDLATREFIDKLVDEIKIEKIK